MITKIFCKFEEGMIAALLVSTTLLVFYEVVMRYGFGRGVLWLEELTLHMAGWFVLFGASYGIKVGAHIQVDVVVNALGEKARRAAGVFGLLAALLYCGLIIYGAIIYLAKIREFGIEMEDFVFPKWIAHSVLVIGFVMLAIRLIQLLVRTVKGEAAGFEVVDEAQEVLKELQAGKLSESAGETK